MQKVIVKREVELIYIFRSMKSNFLNLLYPSIPFDYDDVEQGLARGVQVGRGGLFGFSYLEFLHEEEERGVRDDWD